MGPGRLVKLCRRGASSYVESVRLLDHWQLHDDALSGEFPRGAFVLMVDKRPLVKKTGSDVQLVMHSFRDLRNNLSKYGLNFSIENSCLVDTVQPLNLDENSGLQVALFGTSLETVTPPEDLPVPPDELRNALASALGGRFFDLRMAMLTMTSEKQRNWLAKMHTLSQFNLTYKRCPKCCTNLKKRISKSAAECTYCRKVYYPAYSPVSICLVSDPSNEHALLVRHRGSANGVYTCVAGFATTGEPLHETCRREIAEEVGLEATDIKQLGLSQPWPMPDSSLMIGFRATADRSEKITVALDELESAEWYTRDEIMQAYQRTIEDPFLKGLTKDPDSRQILRYIPPAGAIAHTLIKKWLFKEI